MDFLSLFKPDIVLSLIIIISYFAIIIFSKMRIVSFTIFYFSSFVVILLYLFLLDQQIYIGKFILAFLLYLFGLIFLFIYTKNISYSEMKEEQTNFMTNKTVYLTLLVVTSVLMIYSFFNIEKISVESNNSVVLENEARRNVLLNDEYSNLVNDSLFFEEFGAIVLLYVGIILIMLFFVKGRTVLQKSKEVSDK